MKALCPRCAVARNVDDFKPGTTSCKKCLDDAAKQRRKERDTPGVLRRQHLWQKYRITLETYESLRAAQDYRCAICGIHEDDIVVKTLGRPRLDGSPNEPAAKLTVDHCHDSLDVRGLLCYKCNFGLGHFTHSTELLAAAITYLKKC